MQRRKYDYIGIGIAWYINVWLINGQCFDHKFSVTCDSSLIQKLSKNPVVKQLLKKNAVRVIHIDQINHWTHIHCADKEMIIIFLNIIEVDFFWKKEPRDVDK